MYQDVVSTPVNGAPHSDDLHLGPESDVDAPLTEDDVHVGSNGEDILLDDGVSCDRQSEVQPFDSVDLHSALSDSKQLCAIPEPQADHGVYAGLRQERTKGECTGSLCDRPQPAPFIATEVVEEAVMPAEQATSDHIYEDLIDVPVENDVGKSVTVVNYEYVGENRPQEDLRTTEATNTGNYNHVA